MGITLLLVEDDQCIREAFCCLFQMYPNLKVISSVGDGLAAIEQALFWHPDVALIDIGLPELNGIEVTRRLCDALPNIRIIALTASNDERTIKAMIEAGASGYLSKGVAFDELVTAIHEVMLGKMPIAYRSDGKMTTTYQSATSTVYQTAYERLSPRQREILQLIAEDYSTEAIANKLNISPDTVATHRKQLMDKLNMHSTIALTRYAIQEGVTPLKKIETVSE